MRKLVAVTALIALALPVGAAETDRTIPMPKRDQTVKIDFSSGKARIVSLEIQHYPDSDAIEKAKTKDLNDKHLTFWNFSVENRDLNRKARIRAAVEVVGKDGAIVGKGDKSDTVAPGKLDDNIRVWVRMRTLDIVSAKSAKLHLSIEEK